MSSNPTSDDAAKRNPDASQASDPDATLVGGTPADESGTAGTEVTHEPGLAQPAETSDTPASGEPATEILGQVDDHTTKVFGKGKAVSDSAPTEVLGAQGIPDDQSHPGESGYPVDHGTDVPGTDPYTTSGRHDTAVIGTHGTEVFDAEAVAAMAAAPGTSQLPPGSPPPVGPNAAGSRGGSSWMRGSKRTLLVVALVVALLAVAGLAGGEAYARRTVERCISSQFEQQMGSKIDVSFGAKPMLLTMFDGKVSSVTVESDDSKFGPAEGMVVHAKFNDIEVVDQGKGGGTVGSSSAEVTWSNDGIAKTLSGLVSGVQSNPSDNTLTFAVLGGIAGLTVKPQVVGDQVDVSTESASLLGFGLPTALVENIVDLMAQSLQSYPMGLKPTKVEVTTDGLHVTLAGGKTELPPAEGNTSVTC